MLSPSISPLSYKSTLKVSFSICIVFKTSVFLFSKFTSGLIAAISVFLVLGCSILPGSVVSGAILARGGFVFVTGFSAFTTGGFETGGLLVLAIVFLVAGTVALGLGLGLVAATGLLFCRRRLIGVLHRCASDTYCNYEW